MKRILVMLVFALFALGANAQHVFNKGDVMFNAGIGIPYSYGFVPSINFSGEVGVIPTGDIGLVSFGGLTEFQMGRHEWSDSHESFSRFYFGAHAAWHVHAFNSNEFDAYGGVGFGVVFSGQTDHYDNAVDPVPDVFVGGRWMFSPGMGLFSELGYSGLSSLKFGITFGI
ncbi:MAG: hypothetical protein WC341_06885 [Bacteroidales bacterium]|jgi:hypothetical protein